MMKIVYAISKPQMDSLPNTTILILIFVNFHYLFIYLFILECGSSTSYGEIVLRFGRSHYRLKDKYSESYR